jgi:hypothetical protein
MASSRDAESRLGAALSDRYRIERKIGEGGMATVYLAHDVRHDRQVAIKVLHEDLGATLGPERFLAEIKTTEPAASASCRCWSGRRGRGQAALLCHAIRGGVAPRRLTANAPDEDAVRIARGRPMRWATRGHGIVTGISRYPVVGSHAGGPESRWRYRMRQRAAHADGSQSGHATVHEPRQAMRERRSQSDIYAGRRDMRC